MSWENSWVIFWALTFLTLKFCTLTFPARLYILRRIKFAGTKLLMPKVSRKAFFPLRYQLNSWVPTLIQCFKNNPSTYAVNRLISWDPRVAFTYERFEPMTDLTGGYLKRNPRHLKCICIIYIHIYSTHI